MRKSWKSIKMPIQEHKGKRNFSKCRERKTFFIKAPKLNCFINSFGGIFYGWKRQEDKTIGLMNIEKSGNILKNKT